MPLKKPSDLFGDNSPEENNIPIVEVSEENFDNVFNVFNTYKKSKRYKWKTSFINDSNYKIFFK